LIQPPPWTKPCARIGCTLLGREYGEQSSILCDNCFELVLTLFYRAEVLFISQNQHNIR
jgi:hypothetical protein